MSSVFPDPNRFDLQRIAASPLVGCLEYRSTVASTQVLATRLLRQGNPDLPLLVLASEQTAGRGRGRNPWWSSPGALTFSLALDSRAEADPHRPDPRQALAAGLAVREVVDSLAPATECGLKWPNDVYLAGRKLCGVLVETLRGNQARPGCTVFGIGVNVNNRLRDAPAEIGAAATSLFDVTDRHHDLTDLLLAVVEQLQIELAALAGGDPGQIERWQGACLLQGRQVLIEQGTTRIEGRCRGIDASGALTLTTARGPQHVFSGEVRGIEPPLAS